MNLIFVKFFFLYLFFKLLHLFFSLTNNQVAWLTKSMQKVKYNKEYVEQLKQKIQMLQNIIQEKCEIFNLNDNIVKNIVEFELGYKSKCFGCSEGEIFFLGDKEIGTNTKEFCSDWNLKNYSCSNALCMLNHLHAFRCYHHECEKTWSILCYGTDKETDNVRPPEGVCSNLDACRNTFCFTHIDTEMNECYSCGDFYCIKNCNNYGYNCKCSTEKYWYCIFCGEECQNCFIKNKQKFIS